MKFLEGFPLLKITSPDLYLGALATDLSKK